MLRRLLHTPCGLDAHLEPEIFQKCVSMSVVLVSSDRTTTLVSVSLTILQFIDSDRKALHEEHSI